MLNNPITILVTCLSFILQYIAPSLALRFLLLLLLLCSSHIQIQLSVFDGRKRNVPPSSSSFFLLLNPIRDISIFFSFDLHCRYFPCVDLWKESEKKCSTSSSSLLPLPLTTTTTITTILVLVLSSVFFFIPQLLLAKSCQLKKKKN